MIFIELKITSIRKEINDRESNDEDGDGIIVECEKSAGSSNINEPLDFLKSFLTGELINEIARETNNHAIKKVRRKSIIALFTYLRNSRMHLGNRFIKYQIKRQHRL